MAKTRVTPPEVEEPVYEYDEISAEEQAQAEVGSLFSIRGEQFANVQWSIHRYRTRHEMQVDPSGEKTEWVADVSGELAGADLLPVIGGGTFKFQGYVPREAPHNGVKLAYNRIIRLAGPRRDFNAPPQNGSPPVATATTDTDRRMDRLERMIETLAMGRTAPAQQSMKDMIEGLVALDTLRGGSSPQGNDRELFGSMVAVFEKGIELGTAREPVSGEDGGQAATVLKIVEAAAPVMTKFFEAAAQRRRVVQPQPPPAAAANPTPGHSAPTSPVEPSHAEVMPDVDPAKQVGQARMIVLVDELASGIRDQVPVDEVAEAIEILIHPADLEGMLSMPDATVIESFVSQAGGAYPNLGTAEGRAYLAAVLAELRKSPDEIPPTG